MRRGRVQLFAATCSAVACVAVVTELGISAADGSLDQLSTSLSSAFGEGSPDGAQVVWLVASFGVGTLAVVAARALSRARLSRRAWRIRR
jgi:hypothetical protein